VKPGPRFGGGDGGGGGRIEPHSAGGGHPTTWKVSSEEKRLAANCSPLTFLFAANFISS
jgi:hypothetical protein